MGQKTTTQRYELCYTSGKGTQPLLDPKADALCQSKLIGSAFSVILHGIKKNKKNKLLFGLGKCSF